MAVGMRVFTKRHMPDMELVEKFRGLPTANVCDCMERLGVMDSDIRLMSAPVSGEMLGVALTVKTSNGDNLMIHEAMELAGPHDVIVVDNEGGRNRSLAGMNMFGLMQYRKIAGIVIDGPIRDIDTTSKMDFPVYASGVTARGPYKDGRGDVNVPISCGGVSVCPGDIILGDMDGVLVIPRQDAEAILEKAIPFARMDAEKAAKALVGQSERTWVQKALEKRSVEFLDKAYDEA